MSAPVAPDLALVEIADVLVFPVSGERHAIRLSSVREVVAPAPVAPVPGSPRWLRGMVNLRGNVLPVVDSGRALAADEFDSMTHLVIADTKGGPVAVTSSGPPTPALLGDRAAVSEHAGSQGCYLLDDGVVTLLDLDALTDER